MSKYLITTWEPELPAFWRKDGRATANRNLLISIPALMLAFAVWMVWSVVVVNLPNIGFKYSTNQLFWLTALPGLSGATLRIFYSFMVPIFGGRKWTTISTASLLIPAIGIGFAVPGNLARPVIDQLNEFGETRRGWLGVGIQEVSEDIRDSLGLTSTAGALVIDVTKGGPSDSVIVTGDIILEFDSKPIAKMRDLPRVVAETAVGKAVPVKVLRDGKKVELDITLGRLEVGEQLMANANQAPVEAAPAPANPGTPDEPEPSPQVLSDLVGFDVAPLDEDKRAEFGIAPEAEGIVVTDVKVGSDADQKGFIPGLIVTEVNQRQIATVDELNELIDLAKEAGRPPVLFKVQDPTGASRFIAIRLS